MQVGLQAKLRQGSQDGTHNLDILGDCSAKPALPHNPWGGHWLHCTEPDGCELYQHLKSETCLLQKQYHGYGWAAQGNYKAKTSDKLQKWRPSLPFIAESPPSNPSTVTTEEELEINTEWSALLEQMVELKMSTWAHMATPTSRVEKSTHNVVCR